MNTVSRPAPTGSKTRYLFVLCPPFSGSTVFWRLLSTSPNVSFFPEEGQFLDSVKAIMRQDAWNAQKRFPWDIIKSRWEEAWDTSKPILLEKSPPNLLRAFDIQNHFSPASFIAMMRNPYAFCEGHHRRLGSGMRAAAERWGLHASYQIKNIEGLDRILHFSYEALAENPSRLVERLLKFVPELQNLSCEGSFEARSVLGRGERAITNLNDIKIAKLSSTDISRINEVLREFPRYMKFFGYDFIDPSDRPTQSVSSVLSAKATRAMEWVKRAPAQLMKKLKMSN